MTRSACIFCDIVAGRRPASLITQDDRFLAFMDIHPWRPGHALVVPRRHAQRLADLPAADVEALFGLSARVADAVRRSGLPCDDVHIVLNDGPAASQTVPHAHVHIVPRVRGDFWRMLAHVAVRPFAAPRATLDDHARRIAQAL